jgi:hypothetical protein
MTRRDAILLVTVALALMALGLVLSPADLAAWMTHPARTGTSRAPAAAEALRMALLAGPPVALAIVAAISLLVRPRGAPSDVPAPAEPTPGSTYAALALLVVAGAILRAIRLGDSLWYDEIAGLLAYSIHGPGVVVGNYFSEANQIASQLAIWGSTSALGADELGVRLPSFLAGIAFVPALYLLGRAARGEGYGLLAATAGAFLPVAIGASTDARSYAIVITLSTVATWLLLRARQAPSPRAAAWTWIAFAAVHALLVWAHLAAVCVALGHGAALAVAAIRGRNAERRGALAGLGALVLAAAFTLILYAPALPDLLARRSQFRALDGNEPTLFGPEGLHALLALGGSWVWWATIPGALLALVGIPTVCRDPRMRGAVLLAVAGGPIAVLLTWLGDSWLYARFLLFLAPATALLVAAGLGALAARSRLAMIAGAAAIAVAATTETLRSPPRQPLREAIAKAGAIRGDRPVGVAGLRDQVTLYYSEPARIPTFDLGPLGSRIEQAVPSVRPNAIVLLYPDLIPPDRIAALTREGYVRRERLEGWIDWGKGAVEVWGR